MRSLICGLGALALSACATLSQDECLTADWRLIGLEDGAAGRFVSRIGDHRKACAKHAVSPDLDEYRAGHAEGKRIFCTAANGFKIGRDGTLGYESYCPPDLAEPFLAAMYHGRIVREADQELARLRAAIDDDEAELVQLTGAIEATSSRLVADDTTRQQREVLLEDLKRMQARQIEVEHHIEEMEFDADAAAYRVHELVESSGYR